MEINLGNFSQRTMKVFQAALRFAVHMEHGFIGTEHLLWALTQDQGAAGTALRRIGLDAKLAEEYLHQYDFDAKAEGSYHAVQISQEAEQILHLAETRAKKHGHSKVEPEDLLQGILEAGDCAAVQMLISLKADPEEYLRFIREEEQEGRKFSPAEEMLGQISDFTAECYGGSGWFTAVFGRWADLVKLILGAGLWLFFLYMAAARFLEEPVSVSHIVFWSGLFLVYNLSFLKYWSNKRKTAE